MRSEKKEKSTPTLLLKRREYSLETRQLNETLCSPARRDLRHWRPSPLLAAFSAIGGLGGACASNTGVVLAWQQRNTIRFLTRFTFLLQSLP
jgi:hypothetical protein